MSGEGFLSTPEREVKFGLERATYDISNSAAGAIARASEISQKELKKLLAGWYLFEPRPGHEDILEMSISPAPSGRLAVTLVIRRGQYVVAEILNRHEGIEFLYELDRDIYTISCSCHSGGGWQVLRRAFPYYDYSWTGTFERESEDGKGSSELEGERVQEARM